MHSDRRLYYWDFGSAFAGFDSGFDSGFAGWAFAGFARRDFVD